MKITADEGPQYPRLSPAVAKVPLVLDTPMTGVLPSGNEILGFTLDAKAGDTLDLSYARVSGNMNLGLVVLSEKNEVFFQASLVTSASLATQFTLPEAGQYTIGVFRISLVEPAQGEPTAFPLWPTKKDAAARRPFLSAKVIPTRPFCQRQPPHFGRQSQRR